MQVEPAEGREIAPTLAGFAARLEPGALPRDVLQDAIWRLSDCIAVSLIGSRQEFAPALRSFVDEAGGPGPSTVIGFGMRVPAQIAAFANGVLAHGADFDDTHGQALFHVSSVVVPAALAVGERVRASGPELLTAMIAGAEIGLRIACPVGQQLLVRGLHPTGIVGPFAAAATAARLLGLDEDQTAHALGLAGSQAAGLRQGSHDGSWVKRVHPGWAAQAGVTAASLAARGFTGPRAVIEGPYGLYAALLGGEIVQTHTICADLGRHWLYPETTYKPYANGSWNHASMAAVSQIMQAEGLHYSEIARIDCSLPPAGFAAVCEPRAVRLNPKTAYHMKFSLPYSVAILTVLGHANADDYNARTLEDPRISDFASRVYCYADPQLPPTSFPANVSITTVAGRSFAISVNAQKGSPDNPMTDREHREKFLNGAEASLGARRSADFERRIEQILSAPDIDGLVDMMAGKDGEPALCPAESEEVDRDQQNFGT